MEASKLSNIIVLVVLLGNIIASLYVFSNGFLIRRVSLNDTNTYRNSLAEIKRFNKSILVLVDALRFDFVLGGSGGGGYGLPTLERLLGEQPTRARLYKFIADPPTTTMQRIKALATGSLPTFIDAGANFADSYLVEDDNLLRQLHAHNRSTFVLGDDTWLSLFHAELIAQHFTYPSFNIKDLDSNDANVERELRKLLQQQQQQTQWHFIVAHLLGLDHCGHMFGPKSPVMKRKLADIDAIIKLIVESIDDDTLLVIIGDHGMTETGDHGGDSRLEIESALIFYSKKDLFNAESNSLATMEFEETSQINLTPTLALAMGIPIPFSNLGVVITDLFDDKYKVLKENLIQVIQFVKKYEQIEQILSLDDYNNLSNMNNASLISSYLGKIQQKYREKWSTFNTQYCLLGLFALALSVLSLLVRLSLPNDTSSSILKDSTFLLFSTLPIGVVVFGFSCSISLVIYLVSFNFKLLTRNFRRLSFTDMFKWHEILVLVCVNLISFSNSFIINENVCLRFFLVSLLFLESFRRRSCKEGLLAILVRLTWVFYVCREEVASFCTQTMFATQLEKLPSYSYLTYTLFICVNFSFIFAIYFYLAATRLDKYFLKDNVLSLVSLVLLFFYVFVQLQSYEHSDNSNTYKIINLNIARLIYILILAQLFLSRSKSGNIRLFSLVICSAIFMSLLNSQSLLSVWILLFVLFELFVPSTQMTIVKDNRKKSAAYLEPSTTRQSDLSVFVFLLEHYFLYASGHETTFIHIRWESAFHGFDGDNNNPFVRLLMGLFILFNTFTGVVLCSLFLVAYLSESNNKTRFGLVLKLCFFNSIKVFCSALSVYVLRRHLMVWKIFAPRFIFESLSLILGYVLIIFNYAIFYK